MSLAKSIKIFGSAAAMLLLASAMSACTATGDAETIAPGNESFGAAGDDGGSSKPSSSTSSGNSNSSKPEGSAEEYTSVDSLNGIFEDYSDNLIFAYIPATILKHGTIKYSANSFMIGTREVSQGLYKAVMGSLPKQERLGDNYPVVNVSWYEAALFCNELSKKANMDTAYVYSSIGESSYLENLSVDYSASALRLPTELEWEIAAHGGTTTRFYWGDDQASKYAYYGQSKGPQEVGKLLPNNYGIYDIAGNASEWVNDWYDSYSKDNEVNPVGPKKGQYKCVRGGDWADKVAEISPTERDKKEPLYHNLLLGFRVVYSAGF